MKRVVAFMAVAAATAGLFWSTDFIDISEKRTNRISSERISIAERVGHKVRIVLISRLSDDQQNMLLSIIKNEDHGEIISHDSYISGIKDIDVLVVVLYAWREAQDMVVEDGVLFDHFRDISDTDPNIVRRVSELKLDGSNPVYSVSYNMNAWPAANFSCLAQDIVRSIAETRIDRLASSIDCR